MSSDSSSGSGATLLHLDSFSHYDLAHILDKYDFGNQSSTMSSPGPLGVGSYLTLEGGHYCRYAPAAFTSITMGIRYRNRSGSGNFQSQYTFWGLIDASGVSIGNIGVNQDGAIFWNLPNNDNNDTQGPNAAISANGVMNYGQWQYIEIALVLSQSGAGSVMIDVNGTNVVNATNITTWSTPAQLFPGNSNPPAPAQPLSYGLGGRYPNNFADVVDVADYYVLAGTPGLLGDTQVGYGTVDAPGTTTDLAPFPSGNANWQNVAEISPPDDDTTYNFSSVAGALDAYASSPFPDTTGTIAGFQLVALARKDSAGSRSVKLGVSNGTATDVGAAISLDDSYRYVLQQYDTNPLTSEALTAADFSTLQLVVEVA
jgi:hypothetical protein